MKISSDQLAILESLECQRLSSDFSNMYLVDSFSNDINDDIAQTLMAQWCQALLCREAGR